MEKRLEVFASDKSKENYVRLLYAFRYTDVLIPMAISDDSAFFSARSAVSKQFIFKSDSLYIETLGKRLMPIFSTQKEIPADYKGCRNNSYWAGNPAVKIGEL